MERLSEFILRHPRKVQAAVLLVTFGFGIAASSMRIDGSVEAMLSRDDPELGFYREFKRRFGSDELVIIGATLPHPFQRASIEALQRISTALQRITLEDDPDAPDATFLIDRVASLVDATEIRGSHDTSGESTLTVRDFVDTPPETPQQERELRSRALEDPLYVGNFLSEPETDDPEEALTTLILARIIDRPDDLEYRRHIQERVEEILRQETSGAAGIEQFHVAGVPILKTAMTEMAARELAKLTPASWLVIFGILLLIFRSRRAVLLPLATILMGILWTVGFLTLCGSRLNIVSTVILALIQVIGAATTIFLFSHYYDLAPRVAEHRELLRRTLGAVMVPSFLASLTTALGFFSLAVSSIVPIRQTGIYSAFGVMSTWLIIVTFIPATLVRLSPPGGSAGRVADAPLLRCLDRIHEATWRFRWPILLAGVGLIGIALGGILRIEPTTDFIGFLRASHPLPQAYRFIQSEVGGIRPYDISIRTVPGGVLEPGVLRRMDELQGWLEAQPEVDHTFSVVDYLKRMHQAMHDDDPQFFSVPAERQQVASYLLLLEDPSKGRLAPFLQPNWEDAQEARVLVRAQSLSTQQVSTLVERIDSYLQGHVLVAREVVATHVTGSSVVFASMANALVRGQVRSLLLAFVAIWIVVVLLLRSIRYGTLAMIPNAFPVMAMLGVMGYTGIHLDVGSAMVSAIAMGIAVDDTIHFMTHYRRNHLALGDERRAIGATLQEVGRPIMFTSGVLAMGFLVVCLSSFQPHVYMGSLGGIAIVMALGADLLLLPALLFVFRPRLAGLEHVSTPPLADHSNRPDRNRGRATP